MRSAISNALRGRSVDYMIFEKQFYLNQRKVAIFVSLSCFLFVQFYLTSWDLDSTLIKNETIDEIARKAGVLEEVAEITRRAMAEGVFCLCF